MSVPPPPASAPSGDRSGPPILVREARPDDLAIIVDYNARLASETEGLELSAEVLTRGVAQALADPDRLRYWVAEWEEQGETLVVGQAAVTREWSDWRNGWLWWYQSVYVAPEHRARGVFRALHGRIRSEARAADDVIGLRLYVEQANERAQRTYQAVGMKPGGYLVFEDLWIQQSRVGEHQGG